VLTGVGKRFVSSEQWRIERLGQGEIRRVVGRDGISHLPYPKQERVMPVAMERKIHEIRERFAASLSSHVPGKEITRSA
jgi:hypothetical protein